MNILIISIDVFARVLNTLIFIRVVASWLSLPNDNPIMQLLYTLTEPILYPIRRLLQNSPIGGPGMVLDFSPIISFVLIEVAKNVLIGILK